jgi:GT2 family glycosyltransferase
MDVPINSHENAIDDVGIVVIGRNEGERLRRCLQSVRGQSRSIVYVDSGSADGSVELARALAVGVVELDRSIPFTAARARNAGVDLLMCRSPSTALVFFVDGDCEIRKGWIAAARDAFASNARLGAVAGRLRERFPEASIYNRLCDMEWDANPGEAKSCGGIAVVRASAFHEVGGFNPRLIAGEEPELCVRLRRSGWKIARLDVEMALHDAAMTRFSQWWKRSVRAGHAYAEGMALYGRTSERLWVREAASGWLFALVVPALIVGGFLSIGAWGLALVAVYPLLLVKIAAGRRRTRHDPWRWAFLYAGACIIAKPAEIVGQARYWLRRLLRREPKILEHKTVN